LEIAGISASHLSRVFFLQTGLPPGDYLVKLRMETARDLLVTSFINIKEVMASIGYDPTSRGVFIEQFKRYFELTPSDCRRRLFHREQDPDKSASGARLSPLLPKHNSATDNRVDNTGLLNLFGINSKAVLRQHNHIGQLSNLKRALVLFAELSVSARRCVSAHSFFDRDLLLGHPAARVLAVDRLPSHRRVDAEDRRNRRHKPVGTKPQRRT